MPDRGIYVHIPFCASKCRYCAFNSQATTQGVPEAYVNALIGDIAAESGAWAGDGFGSVYLGGGTPSLLRPPQLGRIMDALTRGFRIDADAEVTMECNPNSLDPARARAFKRLGVTRVSIGVQSMCDHELAALGRSHSARDSVAALEAARSAGFKSVSADVMLGIPAQSLATLDSTLEGLADHVDHISAYLLSIEPATEFDRMAALGDLDLPSEDAVLELYGHVALDLSRRGFRRYEISNWSRPGSECSHNLMYWRRGSYAGVGAGAHSHRDGMRYARVAPPEEYVARASCGMDAVEMREWLNETQMMLEEIMLGLRTDEGIDLAGLRGRYAINQSRLTATIGDLFEQGLTVKSGNNLHLSPSGVEVCDSVIEAVALSALSR